MKKIFTILGICAAFAVNAQIVINEVYGGGGNGGATYKYDYIELKNVGSTVVTLTGATLQYASATGTFGSYQALPSITLQPGQTYLIQEATQSAASTAQELPTPDFIATNNVSYADGKTYNGAFNMSGTNGKLVLAADATQVTYDATTKAITSGNIIDLVGFGSSNLFEGSGAAPAPSNTTSVQRTAGDNNDNKNDFTAVAPTPTNSAGETVLGIAEIIATKSNYLKNTQVENELFFQTKGNASVKVFNANGQLVKSANISSSNAVVNVSALPKGMYIVTTETAEEKVSQKFMKK